MYVGACVYVFAHARVGLCACAPVLMYARVLARVRVLPCGRAGVCARVWVRSYVGGFRLVVHMGVSTSA